jgi:tetratricopeptide (TPR) repeat protein
VQKDPSFWRTGFCLWLCDESARKAADNAEEARMLAELGLIVARQLRDNELDYERFFSRLQGRCEAFLANSLRVAGDHDLAEAAFGRSWTLWREGADKAGLLSEARLLDLEASLRRDQRLFEAALRLHGEALERARREEEGAFLLNKAGTLELIGDYAGALAALDRAIPLIAGKSHPHLRWVLRQNQALTLVRLGRAEEAQPAVAEARHLAEKLGNSLDLLRTRGLAALVDAGLGKTEEAIESLEQVCLAFDEKGHAFDYALVGLDLALLYREEGRWAEIRELAGRMVEIFRERNIHRETIAAVILFQEAAVKEAVSDELVRRLQDYLRQAQAQPGLRFEPQSGH